MSECCLKNIGIWFCIEVFLYVWWNWVLLIWSLFDESWVPFYVTATGLGKESKEMRRRGRFGAKKMLFEILQTDGSELNWFDLVLCIFRLGFSFVFSIQSGFSVFQVRFGTNQMLSLIGYVLAIRKQMN